MHLLLPAQEALTSECLSQTWLNRYPSWAFLFCVISIALMQVLDYFVTVKIAGKVPPSLATEDDSNFIPPSTETNGPVGSTGTAIPSTTKTTTNTTDAAVLSYNPSVVSEAAVEAAEEGVCTVHNVCKDDSCAGQTLLKSDPLSPTVRSQLAAVFLSEASIAVHSVLIGITLGVTNGNEIVPLLIALTFHQFLEGVAIGTAAVYAGMRVRSIFILGLIFALTTPLGTAIGIGVRQSYNTNSPAALLTQGILDAVGAGMLIFLALGDHVNAVKSQARWLKSEGAVAHGACIGAFLAGVAIMCTIALWV